MMNINWLTVFGLVAVSLMLVFYALENRSSWFVLAFAGACVMASVYGFLQGAWPFGFVEGVWSVIALRRWQARDRPPPPVREENVANFIADLIQIAPRVERGAYAFARAGGGCHGFVQFNVRSGRQLDIHRIWTLEPGQGNGSMMLRTLCELADRHGVELRLKTLPIGRKPYPLSRAQLKAWYERHGFQGAGWKLVRKPAVGAPVGGK
jgi:hypothetical protein